MKVLNQDMKTGQFKPVYLLYGEEAFLKKLSIRFPLFELIKKYCLQRSCQTIILALDVFTTIWQIILRIMCFHPGITK